MPIVTGENLYLREGFEPLWQADCCDYVMPDILRCGGLRQTRDICHDAVSHNVIPSPHNFSSGVGLAATLHLMAALVETQLLEFDPTGTAIYEEMRDIVLEDCPFVGSMARTRNYLVNPWLMNFKPTEDFNNWYKYLDVDESKRN